MYQWPPPEWFAGPQSGQVDPFAQPPPDAFIGPDGAPGGAPWDPATSFPPPVDPAPAGAPMPPGVNPAQAAPVPPPPQNPVGAPGAANGPSPSGAPVPDGGAGPAAPQDPFADIEGESAQERAARLRGSFESEMMGAGAKHSAGQAQIMRQTEERISGAEQELALAQRYVADAAEMNRRINEEQSTDPNRAVRSWSTGKSVSMAVAGALAGWLDVSRGGNRVGTLLQQINAELDRDMQAQLEDHKQKAFAADRTKDLAYAQMNLANYGLARLQKISELKMGQAQMLSEQAQSAIKAKYANPMAAAELAAALEKEAMKKKAEADEWDRRFQKVSADRAKRQYAGIKAANDRQDKALAARTPPRDPYENLNYVRRKDGTNVIVDNRNIDTEKRKALDALSAVNDIEFTLREAEKYADEAVGPLGKSWDSITASARRSEAQRALLKIVGATTNRNLTGVLQEGEWKRQLSAAGFDPDKLLQSPSSIRKSVSSLRNAIRRDANNWAKRVAADEGAYYDAGAAATGANEAMVSPLDNAQGDAGPDDLEYGVTR